MDEDSAVLSSSGNRDTMILPALKPAQVMTMTTSLLPVAEMSAPSPMVEVQDPPLTAEVAESSSARVALTTEEVMELATCWYIDFPDC
jgi:cytoskeletal protein RodZ